jgi:hypothetical protein
LLQTVEGFLQTTHMLRSAGIDEAWRLLAVDNFIKGAMEEGILDVELSDRPRAGDREVENKANGGRLDDGAESFVVVNAGTLGVTTNNPARLAPSKGAVGVELMPKDPFTGDDVGSRRARHERPSAVVDEGLVLSSHSGTPERVLESLPSRGRYLVDGVGGA